MDQDPSNLPRHIDINSFHFYNDLQDEINLNLAKLKKDVKIITNLRMTAAEMEVETAFLYHAELWYDIEELKMQTDNTINGTEDKLRTP